jgi:hypothetical protein
MTSTIAMNTVDLTKQASRIPLVKNLTRQLKQSPRIATTLVVAALITLGLFLRIAFIFHHLNEVLREIHAINA